MRDHVWAWIRNLEHASSILTVANQEELYPLENASKAQEIRHQSRDWCLDNVLLDNVLLKLRAVFYPWQYPSCSKVMAEPEGLDLHKVFSSEPILPAP